MKRLVFPLSAVLILSGCSSGLSGATKDYMQNPLFAERYWSELTDRMVDIQINESAELEKDAAYASLVDSTRSDALAHSQEASGKKRGGLYGNFVTVKEMTEGPVLLLGNTLYFAPQFTTYPGPELHVYLSTALDPRDVTFPDPSALDLGLIHSPYGMQQYEVPETEFVFQTVVLWDAKLKRIYGFAQISK